MNALSCKIELTFDYQHSVPVFNYVLTCCAPGWQVSRDGNIRPPHRSRVISIALASPKDATLFGLRFAKENDEFPKSPDSDPYFNNTDGQAKIVSKDNSQEIIFSLSDQHQQLYYQLGIKLGEEIVWDDPRVYNDGSQ